MAPTSYPKDKIKILLLENISDAAVRELQQYGYGQSDASCQNREQYRWVPLC